MWWYHVRACPWAHRLSPNRQKHPECPNIVSAHVVEFAESQNRQQHTKYHQSTQYVKTSNLCLQDLNLCLQHVWDHYMRVIASCSWVSVSSQRPQNRSNHPEWHQPANCILLHKHLELMFTRSEFMFTACVGPLGWWVSRADMSMSSQSPRSHLQHPKCHHPVNFIFSMWKSRIYVYMIWIYVYSMRGGTTGDGIMSRHATELTDIRATVDSAQNVVRQQNSYCVRISNLCLHNWCLLKNTAWNPKSLPYVFILHLWRSLKNDMKQYNGITFQILRKNYRN
jgi:hypothetical protein